MATEPRLPETAPGGADTRTGRRRTLLVPALGLDVGRRVWWPSRLSRAPVGGEPAGTQPDRELSPVR
jgi:hypothetical protein